MGPPRHDLNDLQRFAAELLAAAGLDHDKAQTVARLLATADAMGHTTHGRSETAEAAAARPTGQPSTSMRDTNTARPHGVSRAF